MTLGAHTARADLRQATMGLAITVPSLWSRCFVFLVGFAIQFNALIGGGGDPGTGAIGGYGYRLTDFIAVGTLALLGLFSIAPHRILSFGVFGLLVAVLFAFPMFSSDQRTANLARHYVLYSFATLYVVLILRDLSAIDWFCSGLITGVLATVPVFVVAGSWIHSCIDRVGSDARLFPNYRHFYERRFAAHRILGPSK